MTESTSSSLSHLRILMATIPWAHTKRPYSGFLQPWRPLITSPGAGRLGMGNIVFTVISS
jgi:hypothetical protein